MEATDLVTPKMRALERLEAEVAALSAQINAATARWLELVLAFRREGGAADDDLACWLAFRCGLSGREAREFVRVGEALAELPLIRGAFGRGELSFGKVRSLIRVATPVSERGLVELAGVLTASQLERALRAFRRLSAEDARESQELEFVDYHWGEDGSLFLRARLAAEEGTLLVRALEAARERVRERRREQPEPEAGEAAPEPPRPVNVEALAELAQSALAGGGGERSAARPQLVVHVDAAALTGDPSGRAELAEGPVIAVETARRLGCDCEQLTRLEQAGLPLSAGRRRRTVPPKLRRLLEARDQQCCRFPGCERRRHLQAHHRTHWAQGGETSLDNLLLLCWQHHRLVHEGGYTIEPGPAGELRFRNRHGLLCPSVPRSPPRGSADQLCEDNERAGLKIDARTNRHGDGDRMELAYVVDMIGLIAA